MLFAALDAPRPGIAEDAPALTAERDGVGLLGVFDGLGGAGARLVLGEDGWRSSAYYAARLARAAAAERFAEAGLGFGNAADLLSGAIAGRLAGRHRASPSVPGAVRTRLMRPYPTTAAMLLMQPGPAIVEALALWAGDSRCYALTPAAGLQQLSTDDSPAGADPMRALREDGPMTNVLTADAPARLHRRVRRINGPALLLVASARAGTRCACCGMGALSPGLHGVGGRSMTLRTGSPLGRYRLVRDFVGSANGRWTIAEHEGREFFVKEFQRPKRPADALPDDLKAARSARCRAFEDRQRPLLAAIRAASQATEAIVAPVAFVRHGLAYYHVAPRVPPATLLTGSLGVEPPRARLHLIRALARAVRRCTRSAWCMAT